MKINWFTFVAEIVNFLILVWLLKRFLYGRIIAAMDQREKKIADRMNEAARREEAAGSAEREYRARSEELSAERDSLVSRARQDADGERRRLFEQARAEVDAARGRWQSALGEEQDAFIGTLEEKVTSHVFSIARHVLADLAGADLEGRMAAVFLERLEHLDGQQEREISRMLAAPGGEPPAVITGFPLPEDARGEIDGRLRSLLPAGSSPVFRHNGGLICGIELRIGGRSIGLSFKGYLDGLRDDMAGSLSAAVAGGETAGPEKAHAPV